MKNKWHYIATVFTLLCLILNGCGLGIPQSKYSFISENELSDGTSTFRMFSVDENMTWSLADGIDIQRGDYEKLANGRIVSPISYDGEVFLLYPKEEIPMKWEIYIRTDIVLPDTAEDIPDYMVPYGQGLNGSDVIEDADLLQTLVSFGKNEVVSINFSNMRYKTLYLTYCYDALPMLQSKITLFKNLDNDDVYVKYQNMSNGNVVILDDIAALDKLNIIFEYISENS